MAWFRNPPSAAAASSVNSSKAATEAFNNMTGGNSFWWSSGYAPQWLRADFGTAKTATWYNVTPYPEDTNPPTAWTFQGSNDASSWTTLDTRSGVTYQGSPPLKANTQSVTYTFTNTTAYRYYRLNISAPTTGPGGAGIAVSELRIGDGTPSSWLWNNDVPDVTLTGDYTVGVVFKPTSNGVVTDFMGYRKAATGTAVFGIYDNSGTLLTTASVSQSTVAADGYYTLALSSPLSVTSGTHYMVTAYYPGTSAYLGGANTTDRVYGDLTIPANGTFTFNGSTAAVRYSAGNALPTSTAGDKHIVGVVFDRSAPTTPSAVGAGAFQWAGSGAGKRTPKGAGSGAFTWSGVGAGKRINSGTGVGAFAWAGTGVGSTPAVGAASGVGVGSFGWVGTGVGSATLKGSGSGAFAWSGSGVGSSLSNPTASGVGSYGWSGLAFGSNGNARATVSLTHTPVGILSVIPLVPSTELDHAVPITRMSVLAPVLSAEYPAHPAQGEPGAPVVIDGIVGHVHLWIGGQDVTYWRGGMTIINRWESEAPFGDTVAAFSLPQKNPWDVDGEGDLSFLRPDATVAIGIVETTEGDGFTIVRTRRLWSGFLDAQGSGLGDGEFYDYEAKGTLWQAQSNNREPHAITAPVDIGVWIARVLNAVDGRRWATMPLTPIGITTTTRGSRDDMAMEYVQALLTEAITDDLRQWTLLEVMPGVLRLVLKPAPTTVHATVAYGTPGVDISLRVDQSTRVDRVFMRGIGPKMGGWANVFYPGLETLTAPAYPMASLGDYIGLGTDDADTVSGTGVTDWQRRVDDLRGFANPPVSGVMSSAWVAVIDDLQRRVGVTADGSLGPQTWNATFDRALRGVDLTPRRLAMASKPEAEKYLYTAAGVRLPGVNPAWDGRVPRDVGIDAGPGKSKAQGFKLARKILGRYGTAAASGTIDWITDPNETDRTRISHLSNIKVLGYHGRDVVVQVASKTVELDGDSDGKAYVVTTRVDERARDATAVEDLLEQRRNAQADPSRNPIARNRASRAVSDQRTPWDSESPCGVLRRTAVNGASGLWTVVTIPFAEVGKLAGIRLKSDRPFAFAIFASLRITENKMAAIVGNPFASSDPWRDEKGLLDEYGIIEAWGEQGNACGYSPKTETDDGAPFTGDFILDTPVDYWTETVPYVSVAIFMRGGSGWIEGEFIPAYET